MLGTIDTINREATEQLDQKKRSELGQFMTPVVIAKFMASLFEEDYHESVHLLDAGAGIGSLIASFLEKQLREEKITHDIRVTAYEIDPSLEKFLKKNLSAFETQFGERGFTLSSRVYGSDFIRSAVSNIIAGRANNFTHAILNPPYKKIHSQSDHRKLLQLIGIEIVNLYSAFVALALLLLKNKGELVAIIPRSFCNGTYYKPFRELIFKNSSIQRIHLFDARNQAFKKDKVLQENVIIHLKKHSPQGKVMISRSTDERFEDFIEHKYSFEQIVRKHDSECFIHIPDRELGNSDKCKAIQDSLKDLSLEVSTGPVVDFRSREYIFMEPKKGSVPLIYPSHFNGKEIDWPKEGKKPNAIALNKETYKMLFPNGFYTIVKRFSSKEEKQRIVARVINPRKLHFEYIGLENHLNVFHFNKTGISENIAYGLAAYLNSSFVDACFRSFNGHTQVNATDLRQLKYPRLEFLIHLGEWAKREKDFNQSSIDDQIKKYCEQN